MDCAEVQRWLDMSKDEFVETQTEAIIATIDGHLQSCPACQAMEKKTEDFLEPFFEEALATTTEDDIRKLFSDEPPELAEQFIADAKEVNPNAFAKDDADGVQRLYAAAVKSPRLRALLKRLHRRQPPPSNPSAPPPEGAGIDGSL